MDLSIDKINLKNNIKFKGLEGAYNQQSSPVYKFYAPAHSADEQVVLEFAFADKDPKTAQYRIPKYIKSVPFGIDDTIELSQQKAQKVASGFVYRYKITNKKTNEVRYEVDSFKAIEDKNGVKMNVIEQGNFYGISPKGGSMRHSFLDSDVRLTTDGKKAEQNQEFVRNHFNKLGGSVAGLNWLLKNTDELEPYTYFMTTPDIGVDKVSSHRYWPANHYQCSDLETFKDFNFELFKRGKGYVADGAFTSQGIQSPLFQHVLKWGERSPFYNMLKIDGRLTLGVLPDIQPMDDNDVYSHIGLRLVNPKGENYDKNKPTYIQFFDDRLLTEESQNDGKLHFDTDKVPQDSYEISTHQDSVQPYAFEINPNDDKLAVFGGKNTILLKDIENLDKFLTFENFTIDSKNKVSGATCWDGNVDIIKMNLSNPINTKENRQGFLNAREYIFGVADYWSEVLQAHLILETAKSGKFEEIAQNNSVDKKRISDIKNSVETNEFESLVLKQGKSVEDFILTFPLQSLETSEEMSAVFAQPQFRDEFLSDKTIEKVTMIFNKVLDEAIGEKNIDDKRYRKYVIKTYGNDILRSIYAYALSPEAIKEDGKVDVRELKKVTLKSVEKYASNSPKEERAQVISKLNRGIDEASVENITKAMKKELSKISLDDFRLAEAVVLQGKGGLNWRFDAAKDIGDLDAVRDGRKTFDQIWNGDELTPGVQSFWAEFVRRIRQNNPSAYVINEVTSLGDFMKDGHEADFDPQLTAAWIEAGKPSAYERKPVYQKQVQFLDETNSTTTSEYSKGFNSFSKFAGVNPEDTVYKASDYESTKTQAGRLTTIKKMMEELMVYNQPNSAIFSHMFVGNHDKPSVLHTLPLDMSIFMAGDLNNLDDERQAKIAELTGHKNYDNMCPMAVGVGLIMSDTIDKLPYTDEQKAKLKHSLRNYVNGKKDDASKPSYKRARTFGERPYELTIKDVIKSAGIASSDKDLKQKTLDFHYAMMKNSMICYERMWQVMNACVGVPTLFGGNEFAQTGYETPSKNVYLGIRNEVLHDLKEDENYKKYYTKMFDISGLYRKKGLGVLRDGSPVSLEMTSQRYEIEQEYEKVAKQAFEKAKEKKVNDGAFKYFVDQVVKNKNVGFNASPDAYDISPDNNNHVEYEKVKQEVMDLARVQIRKDEKLKSSTTDKLEIWPIYRKNSKGEQAISIITNLGLPDGVASCEYEAEEEISRKVDSIKIVDKNGNCPYPDGTKLTMVLQNGEEKSGFVVQNGKIERLNKEQIELTDTVCVFYNKK